MNFCQAHWDLLREKIDAAGLKSLISEGGVEAATKLAGALQEPEESLANYDPLMSAMFALAGHALEGIGPDNARTCILSGSCPVCAANEVHEMSCEDENCELKFERFYENAVADEVERSKKLLGGDSGG